MIRLEVQHYEYLSIGPVVTRFAIGDVDVFGEETVHGPFRIGKAHGADRSGRKKTDWAKINKQSKAKKAARKAKRDARRAKRMQRLEQSLDSDEKTMRRTLKRKQRVNRKLKQDLSLNHVDMPETGVADQRSTSSWRSQVMGAVMAMLVPSAHAAPIVEPVTDPGLIYLQTSETGIYRVTYEQLLDQGIDLGGVKHGRLSLTRDGEKVGVRSKGQDKVHGETMYFGPGGWIEFIADANRTLYTNKAVYALYNDSGSA